MIRRILISILLNSLIVYLLTLLGPQVGITGMELQPKEDAGLLIFFMLGAVFWLCFDVIKVVLGYITKPLSRLTLGISNIIISIGVLYIFAAVVNKLDMGVTIVLGSLRELVIIAVVISICNLFFK